MRVRIVIDNDLRWHERWSASWLARTGARAWDEIAHLLRDAVRVARYLLVSTRHWLCGLTGHDDALKLQRQRLALSCSRCGRVTTGWDLSDPTPKVARVERPRYLELVRRRS